jgi:DNA-binding NarL/FixJ family response regulator
MKNVRIMVVDDHAIFRKGMVALLQELPFVTLVGEAGNGQEFLDIFQDLKPDLVFMDIKMPVKDGIQATREAISINPTIKIVTLSMFGEEEYLQNMLDAGAKGFLLKNIQKFDVEKAIQVVTEGKNFFSDELLGILTNRFVNPQSAKEKPVSEVISDREIEVLKLICQGLTNQEIGQQLQISQRTVDGHRANLLDKIGAKNTVGLVTFAIKNKIVEI